MKFGDTEHTKWLRDNSPKQAPVEVKEEIAAAADIITCPNCYGSGTDLDGFNEVVECGLCNGACVVDKNALPDEWKSWA